MISPFRRFILLFEGRKFWTVFNRWLRFRQHMYDSGWYKIILILILVYGIQIIRKAKGFVHNSHYPSYSFNFSNALRSDSRFSRPCLVTPYSARCSATYATATCPAMFRAFVALPAVDLGWCGANLGWRHIGTTRSVFPTS